MPPTIATSEGSLSFYVEQKAVKGFYQVTFPRAGREYRHTVTCALSQNLISEDSLTHSTRTL